jgi:integrase
VFSGVCRSDPSSRTLSKTDRGDAAADEARSLADATPDRHRTLVYVLAYSGQRIGEAVELRLENLNLYAGVSLWRGNPWRMRRGSPTAPILAAGWTPSYVSVRRDGSFVSNPLAEQAGFFRAVEGEKAL